MNQDVANAFAPAREGFMYNLWYMALWSKDVEPGAIVERTIVGETIAFFRKEDGSVAALFDRCPHRFAKLSKGWLRPGDRIMCRYHGLEFGADGACAHNPHGNGHIPPSARTKAYTVVEKHSIVWIWMGEREPTLETIPDFGVFDGAPDIMVAERGHMLVKAGLDIIVDNQLDPSHLSYVHAGILGGSDTVDAEFKVEQDGDTLTITRITAEAAVPSMYRDLAPKTLERASKWSVHTWRPPSSASVLTGVGGPGGDPSQGYGYTAVHILTPETARTTHYYFGAVRWSLLTDDAQENQRILDQMSKTRRFAFEEQDAPIIEEVQAQLDASPEPLRSALLSVDAAAEAARRIRLKILRENA